MTTALIADTPAGAVTLQRILKGMHCTVAATMAEARLALKEPFDLIVAALHFDGSQMFEFLRAVKDSPVNSHQPLICFCSRDTPMARFLHQSLAVTTHVLGAWMYLDEHSYNVYQDPDAELRRVIERCLTERARRKIHEQRLDIQGQRVHLQQLRQLLHHQEWSPELDGFLGGLREDLQRLLGRTDQLQSEAEEQRARVAASRDLKDRVNERILAREDEMAGTEETQTRAEHDLADGEASQQAAEQVKAAGRKQT